MVGLQELMGQEIYDLLYKHYDKDGLLIEDMDDVFYCEDDEIDKDRIPKLEALLTPITDAKSSLVPLEAAKLLAAWGDEKAIDYFEYCIDARIDRLGNLDPHRLHGNYDITYEDFSNGLLHYYARRVDLSPKKRNQTREKIFPPMKKMLALSRELIFDMEHIINDIKEESLYEYLPILKNCYLDFINRSENDLNRQWNLPSLEELLKDWEPEFLRQQNPE
ncbi:hypothetical protein C0J08_15850 [Marinomonas sp. CT5]|uniref:hypothetical protein n=1 Tax=Marinomonas sp. CT5 TaxID=2066133 RepID=UPI001BAF6CC7|nr:hypothetical protein [Marinomonas sp. CT5]QUX96778.1 hypothetical protein C0J08_15850 [Marinomonas sp. CT5]